jgi:hypothetical protein
MNFINRLYQTNPNVGHNKKGRWRIIAIEYIKANPGQTLTQIRKGLDINTTGCAASSLHSAIRQLVAENVVLRTVEIPYKHTLK